MRGIVDEASAATVDNLVVHKAIARDLGHGLHNVRVGHPIGVMDCTVELAESSAVSEIVRARITRAARRIIEGTVFIPPCMTS